MAKKPATAKDPKEEDLEVDGTNREQLEKPDQEGVVLETSDDQNDDGNQELQQDEAAELLKKQVADLEKANKLYEERLTRAREEAEEAQKQLNQQRAEAEKGRKDTLSARLDAVTTIVKTAEEAIEAATRDMKSGFEAQDAAMVSDASARLSAAQLNLARFQDEKIALEERAKALPQQQETQKNGIPLRVQRWLQRHPEYMSDPKKNDKLRAFHWDVIDEGHDFDSDGYIESMEAKLGLRKPVDDEGMETVPETQKPRTQDSKRVQVSAPVSREAPSGSGGSRDTQVHLSAEQLEHARIAGIPAKEYAKQLKKLRDLKANGEYGGRP